MSKHEHIHSAEKLGNTEWSRHSKVRVVQEVFLNEGRWTEFWRKVWAQAGENGIMPMSWKGHGQRYRNPKHCQGRGLRFGVLDTWNYSTNECHRNRINDARLRLESVSAKEGGVHWYQTSEKEPIGNAGAAGMTLPWVGGTWSELCQCPFLEGERLVLARLSTKST